MGVLGNEVLGNFPQLLITCDLLGMMDPSNAKELGLLTLNDVWQKAQPPIKTSIGETSYDTWFSHLRIAENTPGVLTIQAPDEYFKNWIDERYRNIIERCLRKAPGERPASMGDVADGAQSGVSPS